MKKSLYLGNGCLYAQVSENSLCFCNSSISTSQVVGIQEYEIYVNHDNLKVVKTDDVTLPHNGGGEETTSRLSIELKANTSFIIKCNAQNQIDSYIKFEINANGNVSFKEVAAQCYYTNDFQGIIINDRFECVEKQFNTYLEFIKIKSVDALCALNIQYADYFDVIKFRKVGFNDADEMKHHYRAKAVEINDFKKQFEEVSSKFYNVVDNEEDTSSAISLLDKLRTLQNKMPEMACMEAAYLTISKEICRAESYYEIY